MRIVLYGAGAIGGAVAGRLFQAGHHVVLIARGSHHEAIRERGLRLESPAETVVLPIEVVGQPAQLRWMPGDLVMLAVKSQDTADAVRSLGAVTPPSIPVVCMQNGVENERTCLRHRAEVYAACVMTPASHLSPGVVQVYSTPITGIIDVGRWPRGVDDRARELAGVMEGATFSSRAVPDVQRWKYAKLLTNLGNAVEAVCGPPARGGPIADLARAEGEACLLAAGIDHAGEDEDAERRGDLLALRPVGGEARAGGSSWQSLARGAGSIETDYLNGEIVLLGRLHGVPTPVNALLCRLANEMSAAGSPPGGLSPEAFLAQLP